MDHGSRCISADELIQALWPGSPLLALRYAASLGCSL